MLGGKITHIDEAAGALVKLITILHEVIDMNNVAISRNCWLAEQLGIPTPGGKDDADELTSLLHQKLRELKAEITGIPDEEPPSARRGDDTAKITRDR